MNEIESKELVYALGRCSWIGGFVKISNKLMRIQSPPFVGNIS